MSARCQALFVVLALLIAAAVGWQENGRRGRQPSRPATGTSEVPVGEKVPKRGEASKPPGSVNSDGAPGGAAATDERLRDPLGHLRAHIKAMRGQSYPALIIRPGDKAVASESEPGLQGLPKGTRLEMFRLALRDLGLTLEDRLFSLSAASMSKVDTPDDKADIALTRVLCALYFAYRTKNLEALHLLEQAATASIPFDPFILERKKAAALIHETIAHQIERHETAENVARELLAWLVSDEAMAIAADIDGINDPSWLRSAIAPDAPLTKVVRKALDNADPGKSPEDLAETVLRAALRALGYPENKARTLTPSLDGTT